VVAALKEAAHGIVRAALAAADPRAAVLRSLSVRAGSLVSCGVERTCLGRLFLVAVGKASAGMTAGAFEALGPLAARIDAGVVVLPHGYPCRFGPAGAAIEVRETGHPVPDETGLAAARRVAALVDGMREDDLLLFLLSGGGSSLLPLPAEPVGLADKMAVTSLLLASGADITEINTVRKHLSAIKGGRLAARCRGTIETLAVSDVVGDPLAFIASGPTVADPTTFADARAVLQRHQLLDRVPLAVRQTIEDGVAGRLVETPKSLPGRHRATVIASNRIAIDAAADEAQRRGFAPLVLTTSLTGEAREAGKFLASIARETKLHGRPAAPPACLLAGGETTVTIRGDGKGGRNQEIALSAAIALEGLDGVLVASFATDGKEGNTDAAGAYGSGITVASGRGAGLDPRAALEANDSYAYLATAGELIVTGPTGTNVNDVSFVLVG
jgi:glycerate-2-kinase